MFFRLVVLQVTFVSEAFIALSTRVGLMIGMNPSVFLQAGAVNKTFTAIRTLMIFDSLMLTFDMAVQIQSRWEKFLSQVTGGGASTTTPIDDISKHFPFEKFFADAPQPIFKGKSYKEDMEIARGCWRYLSDIFQQLEEFRAFELLRTGLDRTNYLGVKEAKIIAMTCTHAALKRKDLVKMGFKYDNIIMEEAAQILEIETFIPLLLQTPQDGHNRLKR